jgi:hypothetical protein
MSTCQFYQARFRSKTRIGFFFVLITVDIILCSINCTLENGLTGRNIPSFFQIFVERSLMTPPNFIKLLWHNYVSSFAQFFINTKNNYKTSNTWLHNSNLWKPILWPITRIIWLRFTKKQFKNELSIFRAVKASSGEYRLVYNHKAMKFIPEKSFTDIR